MFLGSKWSRGGSGTARRNRGTVGFAVAAVLGLLAGTFATAPAASAVSSTSFTLSGTTLSVTWTGTGPQNAALLFTGTSTSLNDMVDYRDGSATTTATRTFSGVSGRHTLRFYNCSAATPNDGTYGIRITGGDANSFTFVPTYTGFDLDSTNRTCTLASSLDVDAPVVQTLELSGDTTVAVSATASVVLTHAGDNGTVGVGRPSWVALGQVYDYVCVRASGVSDCGPGTTFPGGTDYGTSLTVGSGAVQCTITRTGTGYDVTMTQPGTCSFKASADSDGANGAGRASSNLHTVTFGKIPGTVSMTVDNTANSSTISTELPHTFTITTNSGGVVTLEVLSGGCSVDNLNRTVTSTTKRTCTVRGVLAETATYSGGTSNTVTVSFKPPQTLTIEILSAPPYLVGTGYSIRLKRNGVTDNTTLRTEGGTATYSIANGTSTGCSVTGSTGRTQTTNAGTCILTASAPGGTTYLPATTTFTFNFGAALSPQTISLTGPTTGNVGSPVALTASGFSGTGAITYAASTGCSVTGSGAVSRSTPGTCSVTATIAEDATYSAATSSAHSVVFKAANSIIISGATAENVGTAVALTASGYSGTGSVTWADAGTGTASCTVTSGSVSATTAGTCVVRATVAADSNYNSASATHTVTFSFLSDSITLATSRTSRIVGNSVQLIATGYSGPGAITFAKTGGTATCTVDASTGVMVATTDGTCIATATIAAAGGYSSATSSPHTVTFSLAPDTITLETSPSSALPTETVQLVATGYAGSGAITYADTGSGTATCDRNTSTGELDSDGTEGTCIVTATIAASGVYASQTSSPYTVTFSTTPAADESVLEQEVAYHRIAITAVDGQCPDGWEGPSWTKWSAPDLACETTVVKYGDRWVRNHLYIATVSLAQKINSPGSEGAASNMIRIPVLADDLQSVRILSMEQGEDGSLVGGNSMVEQVQFNVSGVDDRASIAVALTHRMNFPKAPGAAAPVAVKRANAMVNLSVVDTVPDADGSGDRPAAGDPAAPGVQPPRGDEGPAGTDPNPGGAPDLTPGREDDGESSVAKKDPESDNGKKRPKRPGRR